MKKYTCDICGKEKGVSTVSLIQKFLPGVSNFLFREKDICSACDLILKFRLNEVVHALGLMSDTEFTIRIDAIEDYKRKDREE